jgi:hypothetical protein
MEVRKEGRRVGQEEQQHTLNSSCIVTSFEQENVTGSKSTAHTIKCKVSMFGDTGLLLGERRSTLMRAVYSVTHNY